jgi:hypothetical protein
VSADQIICVVMALAIIVTVVRGVRRADRAQSNATHQDAMGALDRARRGV